MMNNIFKQVSRANATHAKSLAGVATQRAAFSTAMGNTASKDESYKVSEIILSFVPISSLNTASLVKTVL